MTSNDKPLVAAAVASYPEVKARMNELQCMLAEWEKEYAYVANNAKKMALRENIIKLRKKIANIGKAAVQLEYSLMDAEEFTQ